MTCTAPPRPPAPSCSMKFGPAAKLIPGTPTRRTSYAGTPARIHFSPRAISPTGNRWFDTATEKLSAFRRRDVIPRPCANLQVLTIHLHFDFVIAQVTRIRRRISEGILRMQLAADFVDGFFDRTVLVGREV